MRALVVDDSRATRMILAKIMGDAGYEVAQAEDGCKAVDYLNENGPVEVMLVDWNMPEMDGLSLLKHVRADGAYADTQVIMVTTESQIARVKEAIMAGANEYVMKPFDNQGILSKLAMLGLPA